MAPNQATESVSVTVSRLFEVWILVTHLRAL